MPVCISLQALIAWHLIAVEPCLSLVPSRFGLKSLYIQVQRRFEILKD